MNIFCIEHVPFEGPGAILEWSNRRGHSFEEVKLFRGDPFPDAEAIDLLVVMGGPMSVNDEEEIPWLLPEKHFVERCLKTGSPILGVCLGAQLLANVLGSRVYPGAGKEIGWFPVRVREEARRSRIGTSLPARIVPLHWHGETFDLPQGAVHLAETELVTNQAFEWEGRVVGLQFHLEATVCTVDAMLEHCASDIGSGKFEQGAAEMRALTEKYVPDAYRALEGILEALEAAGPGAAESIPR